MPTAADDFEEEMNRALKVLQSAQREVDQEEETAFNEDHPKIRELTYRLREQRRHIEGEFASPDGAFAGLIPSDRMDAPEDAKAPKDESAADRRNREARVANRVPDPTTGQPSDRLAGGGPLVPDPTTGQPSAPHAGQGEHRDVRTTQGAVETASRADRGEKK
jgi:hypothetical protein